MLESAVETYFCEQVKRRGGMVKKIVAAGSNFWPDRLATVPGRGLFLVELKRPKGGRLSVGQKELHAQLRAAGTGVAVLWTKEMVDDFLNF